jgi:hypothetical protein
MVMKLSDAYQELADLGLIVPAATPVRRYKYPTVLTPVPNITTSKVVDKEWLDRIVHDAELERYRD